MGAIPDMTVIQNIFTYIYDLLCAMLPRVMANTPLAEMFVQLCVLAVFLLFVLLLLSPIILLLRLLFPRHKGGWLQ